ncbi:MAG: AsmA-like C-terminal region-containing protein, partial [Bacteroidota bacterium]
GGRMKFAGAYDTAEPGDPGFRFHYDLQSLDFKAAFNVLNSFAALAPLGKFLEGRFSSDLVIEGKLGQDLFPKLNTIDAEGLFQTAEAQVVNFKPAQKIGEALDIETLKESTTIKNLMTVFQIEDGRVNIEPFNTRLAGIPLKVQGQHGLDMDMDYQIEAAIPRSLIQGNIVTGTALAALDQLAGQAGRLGLNISPGDTINVGINLGGSISNPTTKFNLLGTNGAADQSVGGAIVDGVRNQVNDRLQEEKDKAEAEVNARLDSARAAAEARLDSLKQTAGDRAQEIQDSIRQAIAAETERLRKEAAEKLKLKLDSIRLDSLKNALPPDLQDAADKLKDELERFNPFKKKKKKDGR